MYIILNDTKINVKSENHDHNLFSLTIQSDLDLGSLYNTFASNGLSEIKLYSDDDKLLGVYKDYTIIETFYYIPSSDTSFINLMKYKVEDIKTGLDQCLEELDQVKDEVSSIVNGDLSKQSEYALSVLAITFTDEQAVKCVLLYEEWKPNVNYQEGDRKRYNGILYKCKQSHTSESQYTPDLIPAIWDIISEEDQGTKENPIVIPEDFSSMEYIKGKYYVQNGVLYLMNRQGMEDGEKISLTYRPSELVGQYFEIIE